MDRLPRGLTRKPNGIRVRVNRNNRKAFDRTLVGDPYSATLIAEARALAIRARECLSLGIPLDEEVERKSLADACQTFLDRYHGDPDVRKKYKNILQKIWLPVLHDTPIDHITDRQVEDRLHGLGVKIKTQKNYVSPLRQVLDQEKVRPNPASGIVWNKKRVIAEKHQVTRYTPKEQASIIAALDWLHEEAVKERQEHPMRRFRTTWTAQARAFYPMLFAFGPRPGEALSLYWEDYDNVRVLIRATHSQGKRKELTKTGGRRRVYVPEWVRDRIDSLPSKAGRGPMFVGHHGAPLLKKANLNAIWRDALSACGYPQQDPYVCRHSRAAELLSMGKATIAECAYQMGHTVQVFESVYAEMIEEFRKDSFDQFEREVVLELPQWKPERALKLVKSDG